MAMNPMQRKANNSFLLGILITLLITGIIIGFLIYHISRLNSQIEEEEALKVYAYVVTQTINSGETIDPSKLQYIETSLGGVDTSSLITALNTQDVEDATTGQITTVYTQKAKVNLTPGTVLTNDLLYEDEALTSDVRTQEYNVVVLPSQLQTGEYIDVRLRLPDGQDLIVVSHKEITIPEYEDGTLSTNNILMNLSEDEILMMSCAIVESYQMNGSMLYATRYVEPGVQEAATPTYIANDETIALVGNNPNIVQEAQNELINRYNTDVARPDNDTQIIRDTINSEIDSNEDAADNVTDKTEDEITALQDERELYIDSIGG